MSQPLALHLSKMIYPGYSVKNFEWNSDDDLRVIFKFLDVNMTLVLRS